LYRYAAADALNYKPVPALCPLPEKHTLDVNAPDSLERDAFGDLAVRNLRFGCFEQVVTKTTEEAGFALFTSHVILDSKHGSIDDSQETMFHVSNLTPRSWHFSRCFTVTKHQLMTTSMAAS
jgi:hypothetical protein